MGRSGEEYTTGKESKEGQGSDRVHRHDSDKRRQKPEMGDQSDAPE